MSLARHTTLKTLLDKNLISRRSYNALARHGYTSLGSILRAYSGGMRFAALAGLGRKAEAEIAALAAEALAHGISPDGGDMPDDSGDCRGTLAAAIGTAMASIPEAYRRIPAAEPGGIKALEEILTGGRETMMAIPDGMARLQVVARRRALFALAGKTVALAACHDDIAASRAVADMAAAIASPPDPAAFKPTEEWDHFVSPMRRRIILKRYELLKRGLSTRAVNLLESAGVTPYRLMELFGCREQEYQSLSPGRIVRKSLAEIYAMNGDFAAVFREVARGDDRQATLWAARYFYPFLFGPSRRFVVEYYTQHGHIPMFHLICSYLRHSDHRSDRIYREARGIIDNRPQSYKTVASRHRLSSERVRQIVDAGPAMLATEWYTSYRPAEMYPEIFGTPYLSTASDSPLARIRAIEAPQASLRGLLHLCSLTVAATMYEWGDFAIAMRGDLSEKTGGKAIFERIDAIVQQRRTAAVTMTAAELAGQCGLDASDPDVSDVARHIARHCMGCDDAGEGRVTLPRTWVDVAAECVDILRLAGEPLRIDEIFRRFKRRCPEHRFTEPEQLRRQMWTDPRIRAVGKRSTYALAEWSHIYFGSMRDLLRDCMEQHTEPVSLDELADYVREHYPDVNAQSLYASLVGDHLGRFVQYDSGFGLSTKEYPGHHRRH